jgi:6-pyruvoyltetrahydropterin/6-carboxytetrahydropterin synthase
MPTSLTRAVRFHAEHRFWMPDWSEERNRATFGTLADPPGHGHDYRCLVTVAGQVEAHTGMIMDLGRLDRILEEEVRGPLDGRHLNRELEAFAYGRQLPTCEAIATWLFPRVAARLPAGVSLARLRVEEDPTLYAECTGLD